MGYEELLSNIHGGGAIDDESFEKPYKSLRAIADLHRPITTKKGNMKETNCMTCIVYRPYGWSNQKYPCPTMKEIEKEFS